MVASFDFDEKLKHNTAYDSALPYKNCDNEK